MNEPESSEQKLANKHTIARRYDVSERTIQEWMAGGTLPFLKIGYIVRFDIAAGDPTISRFRVGCDEFRWHHSYVICTMPQESKSDIRSL